MPTLLPVSFRTVRKKIDDSDYFSHDIFVAFFHDANKNYHEIRVDRNICEFYGGELKVEYLERVNDSVSLVSVLDGRDRLVFEVLTSHLNF